jgi:hypothetical protein
MCLIKFNYYCHLYSNIFRSKLTYKRIFTQPLPTRIVLKDVILHCLQFVTCTRGQVEARTRVQAAPRDSALCVRAHFLSFLHHRAKQCPSCRAWHFHANTHTRSSLALGGVAARDYKSTTLEKSTRLGFTD